MIGVRRIGPDLANAGYRYLKPDPTQPDAFKWQPDPAKVALLYQHLYAPRSIKDRDWSNSPSFKHLFEKVRRESPEGRADALKLPDNLAAMEGYEIVPTEEAKALVDYILGLKRDQYMPYAITGVPAEAPK
jgi:cytochrome c oxidase cbb3-type subunit 2